MEGFLRNFIGLIINKQRCAYHEISKGGGGYSSPIVTVLVVSVWPETHEKGHSDICANFVSDQFAQSSLANSNNTFQFCVILLFLARLLLVQNLL